MATRGQSYTILIIVFFLHLINSQCTSNSQCAAGEFCKRTCSLTRPELLVTPLLTEPITNFSGNTFYPLSYQSYQPLRNISAPFSVSVSFKSTPGSGGYLLFFGRDPDSRSLAVYIHTRGQVSVYATLDNQSYVVNEFTPSFPLNDGNRYCLLILIQPSELTLFINGANTQTLKRSAPVGRTFDITSNLTGPVQPSFLIGARMYGNYRFSGEIYHIYVYHGPLNAVDNAAICGLESSRTGSCQPLLGLGLACPAPSSVKLKKGNCFNELDRCETGLSCYPSGPDDTWTCQPSASTACRDYSDCLAGAEFCYGPLPDDGTSIIPDPSLNLIGSGHLYVDTLHDFSQSRLTFLTVPSTDHPALTPDLTIFGLFNQIPDNDAYLIAKGHDSVMRDFGLYLRGSHNATWLVYSNTLGNYSTQIFIHEKEVDDGNFHTIAATIDTNTGRASLYVDGELLEYQRLEETPSFWQNSDELWIGGRPRTSNYMFNGSIGYVSVFDDALSGPQIRYLSDSFLLPNLTVSVPGVSKFCLPKPANNEKCYTNLEGDRNFSCQKGLVCIPGAEFPDSPYAVPVYNTTLPPMSSPVGYCADPTCTCGNGAVSKICAVNGYTYENDCQRNCYGPPLLHNQGQCTAYQDLNIP